MVFVGGGLAAMLLLREIRSGLPERVAVVDASPPLEQPSVHWSYWSRGETLYDRFAIGVWEQAKVADRPPRSIAPYTMSLVRSTEVFEYLIELLKDVRIEWIRFEARSISRRNDELYEVSTDDGSISARWIFDSASDIAPVFPAPDRPKAVLSGTGIRVTSDREVFDTMAVTLFDPLDEKSFAYLLPLSTTEALLESASFASGAQETNEKPLLAYLRERYPGANFTSSHTEHGYIPLGFAPAETSGPRHILLGTKRGLVKPSAGYGIVRIAKESKHLARLWREDQSLPASRQTGRIWQFMDSGFLELAARNSAFPLALLQRVMRAVPLSDSLGFIDEDLPLRQLATVFRLALPVVLGKQ